MAFIHSSAFVSTDVPLTEDNLCQEFTKCAEELERMAASYREMAKTIEDRKIRIESVSGSAHCGTFEVDFIDGNRLKQYGVVADYSEGRPDADEPLASFFIDPAFDSVIDIADSVTTKMNDNPAPMPWDEPWATGSSENPFAHDEHPDVNSLSEALSEELDQDKLPLGVGMTATVIDGVLHLDIDDMGEDLLDVSFREIDHSFVWKHPRSEQAMHSNLPKAYQSLLLATAMISQLTESAAKDGTSIAFALKSIEDDLRLLKFLIEKDYHK